MLPFDPNRVRKNAQDSSTADLLDRLTIYREGMEPEALDIIEAELHRRGVNDQQIAEHERLQRRDVLMGPSGVALKCSFCNAPAVETVWGWHRLWNKVPLFPRRFRYCQEHRPNQEPT